MSDEQEERREEIDEAQTGELRQHYVRLPLHKARYVIAVQTNLDEQLYRKLYEACQAKGTSFSAFVREAVVKALDEFETKE